MGWRFRVQLQIDQLPPGNPPARLSASTALGVGIVQHLDAEDPPSSTNLLARLAGTLATTLQEFAPTLPELDPIRFFQAPDSFSDLDLQARIRAFTGAEESLFTRGCWIACVRDSRPRRSRWTTSIGRSSMASCATSRPHVGRAGRCPSS
jgi:hypothetical protein